jgi:hypothetical protein
MLTVLDFAQFLPTAGFAVKGTCRFRSVIPGKALAELGQLRFVTSELSFHRWFLMIALHSVLAGCILL